MANSGARKLLSYNLQRLRKDRGLSQEKLAEKADVSRQTIGLYENCSSFPTSDMLDKLANALEVSVADLFIEEGESTKYDYKLTDAAIDDAVQVVRERLKRYTREHTPKN